MGFWNDLADGLAFVISPTTYMITKKAEQGKLKHTGEQMGKGFIKGATFGKVDLDKKKNGNRRKNGNGNGKKNGKKK